MDTGDIEAEQIMGARLAGRSVLLLEDDPVFATSLRTELENFGVARIDVFDLGETAREAALQHPYDMLVLDRQNAGMDGLAVLKTIRGQVGPSRDAPALIITGKLFEPHERIAGLTGGAADYVSKTVDMFELLARIAAQIRQSEVRVNPLANGPLVLEEKSQTASFFGQPLELKAKSFLVLSTLTRHAGAALPMDAIYRECWPAWRVLPTGWEDNIYTSIRLLREQLKEGEAQLPAEFRPVILNLRGRGYMTRDLSAVAG